MRQTLLIFALSLGFVALNPEAQAQSFGKFTERGFGGSAEFSSHDDVMEFVFGAGYVVNPIFEVGVGVTRIEDDASEISATGFGPAVGIYPFRQSDAIPVSMHLGASYTFLNVSGGAVDELEDAGIDVDVSGNMLVFSGALHREIHASPGMEIIPAVEVGYARRKIEFEASGFGESISESEDDNATFVELAGSLLFRASPASRIAVTPSVTFSEGDSVFGISVALVLPR